MEIQVSKLRELMELLKPAVGKKTTLKATTHIYLGNGKAIATDLETMIIANLPEAKEPMLVPFAPVAEMLKYVPGVNTLRLELRSKTLALAWDGGTVSYPTEAVQDFPVLPDLPVIDEGLLDGDTLLPAIRAALPYAATEETRPVLCGVAMVLSTPLDIDAGDGFRLSHQVLGLSFPGNHTIIVPRHAVDILGHVFAKTPRTPPTNAASLIPIITAKRQLRLALSGDTKSDQKLQVDFGTTASVIINLIQGNFPSFSQLIPHEEPVLQSQLFAPQMEAAVRRVKDIANGGSGIVRMQFADGKVTVSARGEEQEISSVVDVLNTQGQPGRTALNYKYLSEYLSKKTGIIVLSKYTDTGPVVFQYQNSPKVLIMPMYVQWGDEKPAEAEKTEPAAAEVAESPEPETEERAESSLQEETAQGDQDPEGGDEAPAATQEAGVEVP